MTISTFSVSDMHCSACAGKIQRALAELGDVTATHINPVRRQVLVEHGGKTDPLTLLAAIESAGFTPTLTGLDDHDARQRSLLKRLGIAGLAMMQVMMAAIALYAGAFDGIEPAYERLLQHTSLLFTIPVVCYSAVPFFTSALGSCRPGAALSMDVPIALAIVIAFATSLYATVTGAGEVYYDSVVMFTFLLLGARYIDNRLQRRFDLTSQLLAALPSSAIVVRNGERHRIGIDQLVPGDVVWVEEGAQLPVDGKLISPAASIDEAVLTGESDWVRRSAGEPVFAGTFNSGAGFEIRATHAFDQSRIADIARMAEQAEIGKAAISRLADRVAGIFIPAVLSLAALAFVGWQLVDPDRALVAALTVLVVSCPCALSLATPAALTAAMTRLRQLGVVLTRSEVLERVGEIDRIYIDKTGTLTESHPAIESVTVLASGWTDAACRSLAAMLQQHSTHPFARAFHAPPEDASRVAILVREIEIVTGHGVQGTLDGCRVRIGSAAFAGNDTASGDDRSVHLNLDGRPLARFEMSNRVRPDAARAVATLKQRGIRPVMLSGDSAERCAETAGALGIDYLARQSPEAKLTAIQNEQAGGHHVLMIGDGINDVPVLAAADVSAAVVEASEMAKSKADILLLSRRLAPMVDLFGVASATARIIRQNLIWAAAYNLTAVPIAALGFMPPWLAALGMASSSTLVMLNATRLLSVSTGKTTDAGVGAVGPGGMEA